jgi:hypothetical protein
MVFRYALVLEITDARKIHSPIVSAFACVGCNFQFLSAENVQQRSVLRELREDAWPRVFAPKRSTHSIQMDLYSSLNMEGMFDWKGGHISIQICG